MVLNGQVLNMMWFKVYFPLYLGVVLYGNEFTRQIKWMQNITLIFLPGREIPDSSSSVHQGHRLSRWLL